MGWIQLFFFGGNFEFLFSSSKYSNRIPDKANGFDAYDCNAGSSFAFILYMNNKCFFLSANPKDKKIGNHRSWKADRKLKPEWMISIGQQFGFYAHLSEFYFLAIAIICYGIMPKWAKTSTQIVRIIQNDFVLFPFSPIIFPILSSFYSNFFLFFFCPWIIFLLSLKLGGLINWIRFCCVDGEYYDILLNVHLCFLLLKIYIQFFNNFFFSAYKILI